MTEIEAINELLDYVGDAFKTTISVEAVTLAREALEEIQQYRAIGTVEDIREIYSLCKILQNVVKDYSAIGTIDEFKALKEKNEPKKPYKGNFGVIRCSCCDEKVGQMVTSVLKEDCMNFCAYCGSKVDWQ